MSDGTEKAGGDGQPTSPVAAQPEPAAVTPSDSGVSTGVQQRIDSVTAQKNEWQTKAKELETALEAEREKSKTEHELAMDKYAQTKLDEFRKSEHEPLTASAAQMELAILGQVDHYKGLIAEDKQPTAFEELPPVQRLAAYRALAESLGSTPAPPATGDGSGNPKELSGEKIAHSDIVKWGKDTAEWALHREDVLKAQKEGRIDFSK